MRTRPQVFVALALAPLTLFPLFLGVMVFAAYIVKFVTNHSIGPIPPFNLSVLSLPAFITSLGYAVTALIAGPVVFLSMRRQSLRLNRVRVT